MFTKRYSRTKSDDRREYIEPFSEPDTEGSEEEASRTGKGYMAELDQWLDEAVFEPIEAAISSEDSKELHIAFNESKQQIKRRVLQSYHNGLKSKDTRNQKRYGTATNRRN